MGGDGFRPQLRSDHVVDGRAPDAGELAGIALRVLLYSHFLGLMALGMLGVLGWPGHGDASVRLVLTVVLALWGCATLILCPIVALFIHLGRFLDSEDAVWMLILTGTIEVMQVLALLLGLRSGRNGATVGQAMV